MRDFLKSMLPIHCSPKTTQIGGFAALAMKKENG
jgi:hypothetical protein